MKILHFPSRIKLWDIRPNHYAPDSTVCPIKPKIYRLPLSLGGVTSRFSQGLDRQLFFTGIVNNIRRRLM